MRPTADEPRTKRANAVSTPKATVDKIAAVLRPLEGGRSSTWPIRGTVIDAFNLGMAHRHNPAVNTAGRNIQRKGKGEAEDICAISKPALNATRKKPNASSARPSWCEARKGLSSIRERLVMTTSLPHRLVCANQNYGRALSHHSRLWLGSGVGSFKFAVGQRQVHLAVIPRNRRFGL